MIKVDGVHGGLLKNKCSTFVKHDHDPFVKFFAAYFLNFLWLWKFDKVIQIEDVVKHISNIFRFDMTTLQEQVMNAIRTKDRDQYEQLAKQITKLVGTWDRQGRYTIDSEFATHTSVAVRTPTRAWPKSEYEHAQTRKYLTALAHKNQWLDRERLTERHHQTMKEAKAAQVEVAL